MAVTINGTTGITTTGITTTGDYDGEDDDKILLGTSDDLQIYHDGSHSFIKDAGTGTLRIEASEVGILSADGSETMAQFVENGAASLRYDNSTKFETASYGTKVTGFLKAYENESDAYYTGDNWHIIQSSSDNNVALIIDHSGDSAPYGIYMRFSDTAPDNNTHYFMQCNDGTDRFVIWSDGDVDNHDNSYGGTSDVKLKENIVDAKSQWDDIKAVKVRNFNFKSDKPSDKRIGVVAQEIETVCPSLVDEHPDTDENNKDLGTTTKSVKYSILYMKAIKALQEAMARIETLETKVAALEAA